MARVEFEDVSKVFGDGTRAVDGLDLEIADGEFMVLVGPSGCGKTTALRMVAGLEDITDGTVRIGDRVVNDLSPKSRDIAMVFQSYALYPHLTVDDNIAFAAQAQEDAEGRDPAPRATRRPGSSTSSHCSARKPRALSGGQRQRVAMGRAIVRQPAAFLMDEPLSNLDAKLRVQMRADIKRIQADLGVDDDLRHPRPGRGDDDGPPGRGDAQGRAAAGRAAAGALRRPGQRLRRRLHRQPGDEHARGADRARRTAASRRRWARRGWRWTTRRSRGVRRSRRTTGREVVLGIRPEDLDDAALANGDPRPRLQGQVEMREALGSEVLVHFTIAAPQAVTDDVRELAEDVGDDRAVDQLAAGRAVRTRPRSWAASAPGRASREGDAVEVVVDQRALHFFDLETGRAIRDDAVAPA